MRSEKMITRWLSGLPTALRSDSSDQQGTILGELVYINRRCQSPQIGEHLVIGLQRIDHLRRGCFVFDQRQLALAFALPASRSPCRSASDSASPRSLRNRASMRLSRPLMLSMQAAGLERKPLSRPMR